ncbi:MAG: acyl-CoA reductase [Chitinophagales bacterium]|nr:acyl-CoA reductase [Chitinophagales bacterium]
MEIKDRIESFTILGDFLIEFPENLADTIHIASVKNHWFTKDNIQRAIQAIAEKMLNEEKLQQWIANYNLKQDSVKNIGVIAAGNIPLVSFHDILSVLISGHRLFLKTSEKDRVLPTFLLQKLISIHPQWKDKIVIDQRWSEIDAVIATGSNNSGRYFEYYFGSNPHIIRENRHAVAVLHGNETHDQLFALGKDVFEYFGLGCRNVSLLWLPKGYQFDQLIEAWKPFADYMFHHSYKNNLDYQRTILLMNNAPIVDCDFINMTDKCAISAPISCLNLAYYEDVAEVQTWLEQNDEEIQCAVNFKNFDRNVDFGIAQEPELTDYADGVDTMQFLSSL